MENQRISRQAMRSYNALRRSRNRYNTWLFIKLFIYVCLTAVTIIERYYDIPGVQVSGDRKAIILIYTGLGILMMIEVIRFLIVNCGGIPWLSNIQERMEQREFDRLKKTYQYQLRVK